MIRDPVLRDNVTVDVPGENVDRGGVAAGLTPGVCAGNPGNVLVDGVADSVGVELLTHPEQHEKKMMNPARITGSMNA